MNKQLEILEDLLKKGSDDPESIDLEGNEVDHYFYFDKIKNQRDKELAWSQFEESKEIRERLKIVENKTQTINGWGYRVAEDGNRVSNEELLMIVENYVKCIAPIILKEEYNQDVIKFIDKGFKAEIAPLDMLPPEVENNHLFGALYEGMSETLIKSFPLDDHYDLLYNWAIYLTKCDEVAFYLLWPVISKDVKELNDNSSLFGVKLWMLNCRARFWIQDIGSNTIYVKPPWN